MRSRNNRNIVPVSLTPVRPISPKSSSQPPFAFVGVANVKTGPCPEALAEEEAASTVPKNKTAKIFLRFIILDRILNPVLGYRVKCSSILRQSLSSEDAKCEPDGMGRNFLP